MDDILAARTQMGMSLGFHIIFACAGIGLPLLMVVSEWLWHRTGDKDYLTLTKFWSKATAVLFAVGAVSGTVLSFELGLLFPGFMRHAGALIGLPFSLEGFAFFTEAIFLGIYLYGWNRVSPGMHLASGVFVALSGAASAFFVMTVNSWMNAPTGFTLVDGQFAQIDPIEAMMSPFVPHQVLHMLAAAYMCTAFAAAGLHAWGLLKNPRNAFHSKALLIALVVAVPFTLVQPLIGHFAGFQVAKYQPAKLAAMEGQFKTEAGAPLRIGGIVDQEARETRYALEIPYGLSILATNNPLGVVKGLEEFPREDWPHPVVHYSFQIMVVFGMALAGVAAWSLWLWYRKRIWNGGHFAGGAPTRAERLFLFSLLTSGPLAFVAMETGWMVTEIGRQPWIVYNVMRTSDAVTPMPEIVISLVVLTLVYIGLAFASGLILWRLARQTGLLAPDVVGLKGGENV